MVKNNMVDKTVLDSNARVLPFSHKKSHNSIPLENFNLAQKID
jgi:hypothetical protein